jgi:hemerythrin
MRKWSESYEEKARFLCVCVDGRPEEVAREFQREIFGASTRVLNAFIDDPEDFPQFPTQLGCQGFVVFDESGHFATLRSPSLNKVGPKAFEYVERVLDQLITPAPAGANGNERDDDEKKQEEKSNHNKEAKRAYFSTNVCNPKDAPQSLEEENGTQHLLKLELPSVGHEAMDEEHAQLEGLMRVALESKKASDVASLKKMFAAHAKEEEELMKQSSFGESGEVSKISVFSALTSHTADHADIVEMAEDVIASATCCGKVGENDVRGLCRRIVEHAVAFDSRYIGKLQGSKKRKQQQQAPALAPETTTTTTTTNGKKSQ